MSVPTKTAPVLRSRITISCILVMAIIVIVGILMGVRIIIDYNRTIRTAEERLTGQCKVADDFIDSTVSLANLLLNGVIKDLNNSPQGEINHSLSNLVQMSQSMRTILILDAAGICTNSNRTELIGKKYDYREYFTAPRDAADKNQLFISQPFKSVLGVYLFNISKPIISSGGEFKGVVAIAVEPEYIRSLLKSTIYAPDNVIRLIHSDGLGFLAIPDIGTLPSTSMVEPGSLVERYLKSGRDTSMQRGSSLLFGDTRIEAFSTSTQQNISSDKHIIVSASRDIDAVLFQWRIDSGIQILFFAFFAALSLIVTRKMVQRNEQILQMQQSQNSILLSVGEGVLGLDSNGAITFSNPAVEKITGWKMEELVGNFFHETFHYKRSERSRHQYANCPVTNTLKDGVSRIQTDCILVTREAAPFPAEYMVTPITDNGRVTGSVVVFRDVTEQRVAESVLNKALNDAEEASRAKSEFIANISHEVRTPMNAIIGLSRLALDTEPPPPLNDYLQKIQNASRGLLGILNDILDYSKMESGRFSPELEVFSVRQLLDNVNSLFVVQASEHGVSIIFDVMPGVPDIVKGDSLRLGQILNNLVGNAVKFTHHGEIRVTVELMESPDERIRLRFQVCDTGIGLAPENTERLFRPFVQGDSTITRKYGGSGLGLSICKQLVELMGGEIFIQSTLGKGSTFSFTVCCHAADEAVVLDGPYETVNSDFEQVRGARVLLVEDNVINQQVAQEFLEKTGVTVVIAANGEEACHFVQCEVFDLILMDIQMPVMDGLTATKLIRATENGGAVPIIAMTAASMSRDRQKIQEAGMNELLEKPIDPAKMRAMLVRWIKPGKRISAAYETPEIEVDNTSMPESLTGFDITGALSRLGGNKSFYYNLMYSFSRDISATASELKELLDRERYKDAAHLLHTIRGAAGNLGAVDLFRAATVLEAEVLSGNVVSGSEFARLLETTREMIIANFTFTIAEAEVIPLDQEQLSSVFASLMSCLAGHKAIRFDDKTELRKKLYGHISPALCDRLFYHLETFAYAEARTTLKEIALCLEIRLGETL